MDGAGDGIGPNGPTDELARLESLRGNLLERLRARRQEVEEAIVAAGLRIGLAGETEAEGPEDLRAAAGEVVELIGELIEHGAGWTPRLTPAVAAQVRQLARSGVGLDVVTRGYYATVSLCFEFAASEVGELPEETLPYLVEIQSRHGDRLLGVVSAEYEAELARLERSPSARRREDRVQRLLAGETADATDLEYDLERWNLGLIVVGAGGEQVARRLAERLGCGLLTVPRSAEVSWAWLGADKAIPFAELERAARGAAGGRIALASGETRRGVEGWRLTHREARVAYEVMRRGSQRLVRCSEVVLLAALLREEELAEILLDVHLGALERRPDGRLLRETLRAYFASGCNGASAAASLGVDRHTVQRRLHRVEEAIGRGLKECRAEIEVALRVEEHRDGRASPLRGSRAPAMHPRVPFERLRSPR